MEKVWYNGQNKFGELRAGSKTFDGWTCIAQNESKDEQTCSETYHCGNTGNSYIVIHQSEGFAIYQHKVML